MFLNFGFLKTNKTASFSSSAVSVQRAFSFVFFRREISFRSCMRDYLIIFIVKLKKLKRLIRLRIINTKNKKGNPCSKNENTLGTEVVHRNIYLNLKKGFNILL
jgi:hypothetical protein